MDHYIEIRLLPDPEFGDTLLMNALFAKLHRALATEGHGEVGVSFPKAKKTLGGKLRLHGSQEALQRLMSLGWIKGLNDYTVVSAILSVPENCRYCIVKREQVKSSIVRLYRRSVKNGRMSLEKAEEKILTSKEQRTKQPFIQLVSSSSGQQFRLFIHQGKLLDSPYEGKFSAYGLSGEATIPWF